MTTNQVTKIIATPVAKTHTHTQCLQEALQENAHTYDIVCMWYDDHITTTRINPDTPEQVQYETYLMEKSMEEQIHAQKEYIRQERKRMKREKQQEDRYSEYNTDSEKVVLEMKEKNARKKENKKARVPLPIVPRVEVEQIDILEFNVWAHRNDLRRGGKVDEKVMMETDDVELVMGGILDQLDREEMDELTAIVKEKIVAKEEEENKKCENEKVVVEKVEIKVVKRKTKRVVIEMQVGVPYMEQKRQGDEVYDERCKAFEIIADKNEMEKRFTKTRMCDSIINGQKCRHGTRCRFAHNGQELKIRECTFGKKCKFVKCTRGGYINKMGKFNKVCNCIHPDETDVNYNQRNGLANLPTGPAKVVQVANLPTGPAKVVQVANLPTGPAKVVQVANLPVQVANLPVQVAKVVQPIFNLCNLKASKWDVKPSNYKAVSWVEVVKNGLLSSKVIVQVATIIEKNKGIGKKDDGRAEIVNMDSQLDKRGLGYDDEKATGAPPRWVKGEVLEPMTKPIKRKSKWGPPLVDEKPIKRNSKWGPPLVDEKPIKRKSKWGPPVPRG
jgi:hypothetical protein